VKTSEPSIPFLQSFVLFSGLPKNVHLDNNFNMEEPKFKKTKVVSVDGAELKIKKHGTETFRDDSDSRINISPKGFVGRNRLNFFDCYTIDKLLGEGANGKVMQCTSLDSGIQRAVKIMRQSTMTEAEKEIFLHETSVLKSIDHPNIIKIYEYFENSGSFYVVMDLCKGGELFYEITRRQEFTEKEASLLIRQVLSCIQYCHNQRLVHRDLKPENIMLESRVEFDKIKLIDFGQACWFGPNEVLTNRLGTPYYVAPEVLRQSYNYKCDIWSIGVITYVLLCGYPPFDGTDNESIFRKVRKGVVTFHKQYWGHVSDKAKDFIRSLLTLDPKNRPTAGEALRHPWLENANSSILFSVPKREFTCTLDNIKKFHAQNQLKKAALAYIACQLVTKTERENVAKIFRAYDKNGDGLLSREEIRQGFENHYIEGVDIESFDAIFDQVDIDGSGTIDYSEFIIAAMHRNQLLNRERLTAAFKMFDQDGDGSITWTEIKRVLSSATENQISAEHIRDMIKQADIDGDGCLSVNEFIEMMLKDS